MAQATSNETITIRPAALAEAAQLAQLACQLGYPATSEQVASRLQEILRDAEHIVFVAEERPSAKIVGYIEIFPFRTIAADPRIEIASLVVDNSRRSRGIGRLLVDHAEEWARTHGFNQSGLRSNVIRDRAHLFYENLGYRVNKTQKSFRKPL
jgi:GNAT superfamily N-acetyltransferase